MSIEQNVLDKQETPKTIEANQSIDKVEVSEEEKQAKATIIENRKLEDNKRIEELKNELMGKIEKNEFGESNINNLKILDLIAEIEFGATIEDEEMREMSIQNWKRNVQGQYNDAVKESNRKYPGMSVIYGKGGKDRFQVTEKGEIALINNPNANLTATSESVKRAKELGMKIIEG